MKFVHQFSRSLACEMIVSEEPPPAGETHIRSVLWTGQPKRKHLREYVRWCHSVNEQLAALWNKNLLHAVQVSPRIWEFWSYEPGRPAELLKKTSKP